MSRLFWSLILTVSLIPFSASGYEVPERFQNGVTVVHSDDMAPMSFVGVNGVPKGFVIDYWELWSKRTGVPVAFRLMNWQQGLELVRTNETAIQGGLYVTPERLTYLQYSDTIFPMEAWVFTMRGRSVLTHGDLSGRSVGVLRKGASEELMALHHPDVRILSYSSYVRMLVALIDNEVEFVAGDFQTIMYLAGTMGVVKDIVPQVLLSEESLHAAVALGRDDLFELVEYGVSTISEAERTKLLNKWFVLEKKDDRTVLFLALGAMVAFLLALSILYFGSRNLANRDR